MDPNGSAHPGSLQFSAADVPPEGCMAEAAVALRLRVADPFMLYWLLQQRLLLFEVFLASLSGKMYRAQNHVRK